MFQLKDFCRLMIASFKVLGIEEFNINQISREVGLFYDNFDTKILFANMCIGKENEIIGLKEYLWDMSSSGYGYFIQNGVNWKINISNGNAMSMIEKYPIDYQLAMTTLVSEYCKSKIEITKKKEEK